ncbi:CAP domain-containing protein [Corynebacterium sp. H128]|uniref:CAP domain-containing protein n=1 Tax=unclassified Corynebacterium TaxID=2624378 RepID=UPI0030949034
MKKILTTATAALAISFGLSTVTAPVAGAFPLPGIMQENLGAAEADIFNQVNGVRAEHGLAPFGWNQNLADSSRSWAETSASRDQLAHDPMALQVSDMENVAVMYNNPRDAVNAWMNSPAHRDNILSPNAVTAGVGVAKNPATGGYFITLRGAY